MLRELLVKKAKGTDVFPSLQVPQRKRRKQRARVDWQAQGVETMGVRNAKAEASREVLEEYIQHVKMPVDDERHQSRPKQEDGLDTRGTAEMAMQRKR